ncbi:uncharacterized protein N7511_006305 [Penicillium nucicola]|uniref:uncharacterized protein n=1 Tax=Penicillium nucicola TaxID=1850975 RepID=UPI002545B280|nr:uncharacterized protein N7511_006305 [Penicillium nucicola]KAJ5757611.1 hypothetical protein N7511_006305 [Penicillium nucicola]
MPITQKGPHVQMLHAEWVKPRERPTLEEAEAHIHKLYDSGKLFFTKKAIRDLWAQCQRNSEYGDKITTIDLNGDEVELEAYTGQIKHHFDKNDERCFYVYKELEIRYETRAGMLSCLRWSEHTNSQIYCSLQVCQRTHLIHPETKELLPPYPTVEPEVSAQHFEQCMQEWKDSQTCYDFRKLLSTFAKDHQIDKIVGFALGSMSYLDKGQGDEKTYHCRRSASQHALQLTIKDWLFERNRGSAGSGSGSGGIASYVQDPWYTAIDKGILTKAGLEVIDDPRAWLEVDEQSVVLSIAPNVPVKEILADLARPAIFIWCRVTEKNYITKEEGSLTDPDSPRVRKMLEEYDIHEFGPDTTLFSDIAVYIRKSAACDRFS